VRGGDAGAPQRLWSASRYAISLATTRSVMVLLQQAVVWRPVIAVLPPTDRAAIPPLRAA
jgi:hypothetical protein